MQSYMLFTNIFSFILLNYVCDNYSISVAECDYSNPHSYRHGFITRLLLDPENDIKTVAEIASHRSTSTTLNTYFHSTDRRNRKTVDWASLNPNGETPPMETLQPLRLAIHDKA